MLKKDVMVQKKMDAISGVPSLTHYAVFTAAKTTFGFRFDAIDLLKTKGYVTIRSW